MKKRKLLTLFGSICLVLVLVALLLPACAKPAPAPPTPAPPVKPIELKYASYQPEGHVVAEGERYWVSEVEKRSGGQIKITIYYAKGLGNPKTYADLVVSRAADVATVVPGWHTGRFPFLEILNLPFLWPSGDISNRVFYELYYKGYFDEQLAKNELKLCSLYATDPYNYIGVRPAKTPADVEGVKIRSGGGPWTPYIEALGSVPVSFPTPDLYLNLEKKIVEGTFMSVASAYGLKLHEVADHVTLANVGGYSFMVAMSQELYDSFPENLQKVIDDVLDDTMEHNQGARYDRVSAEKGLPAFREAGATIYTPTPEELGLWKAPAKGVIQQWIEDMEAKGLPGRKLIEDLVTSSAKYGVVPY